MKVTPSDACKDNEGITLGDETKSQLYTGITTDFFFSLFELINETFRRQ